MTNRRSMRWMVRFMSVLLAVWIADMLIVVVRTPALPQDDLDCIVCSSTDRGVRHHSAIAGGQELSVGEDDAEEGFGQQRGAVEAFGAEEAEAEGARGGGEGDVDVVEDLDVVREEADGLEDECGVAFVADGGEGVFDGGADPGASGDALALEGEEPFFEVGELAGGGGEDELGGALGLDGVGVGVACWGAGRARDGLPVMVRQGTEWAVKRTGREAARVILWPRSQVSESRPGAPDLAGRG